MLVDCNSHRTPTSATRGTGWGRSSTHHPRSGDRHLRRTDRSCRIWLPERTGMACRSPVAGSGIRPAWGSTASGLRATWAERRARRCKSRLDRNRLHRSAHTLRPPVRRRRSPGTCPAGMSPSVARESTRPRCRSRSCCRPSTHSRRTRTPRRSWGKPSPWVAESPGRPQRPPSNPRLSDPSLSVGRVHRPGGSRPEGWSRACPHRARSCHPTCLRRVRRPSLRPGRTPRELRHLPGRFRWRRPSHTLTPRPRRRGASPREVRACCSRLAPDHGEDVRAHDARTRAASGDRGLSTRKC